MTLLRLVYKSDFKEVVFIILFARSWKKNRGMSCHVYKWGKFL